MVEKYYKLFRRLGKDPLGNIRRERISRIYPDRLPEEAARVQDEQRLKHTFAYLMLSLGLAFIMFILPGETLPEGGSLTRPEPGTGDSLIRLDVQFGEESVRTEMVLSSREYTEEEKAAVLDEAGTILEQALLGENPSADQVSLPLDLSGECGMDGVEAYWIPQEPEVVGYDGTLNYETDLGENRETVLNLYLSFEGLERCRQVKLVLVEPEKLTLSSEEEITNALELANGEDITSSQVILPAEIAGTPVTYQLPDDNSVGWMILVLGIIAAAASFFLPEQRMKEAEEARQRELELGYSGLVSKLCVLVGAGLSVRGAWESIVSDYRHRKAETGEKKLLYEEMERSLRSLGQGIPEEQMYSRFGRRCGMAPYLRLGSLLESHVKNGTRGFTELLSAEADEAFRERLQLARRQGEEISTKLMLPLLILFALVSAILVIPAFLSV